MVIARGGQIVDATIVQVHRQTEHARGKQDRVAASRRGSKAGQEPA